MRLLITICLLAAFVSGAVLAQTIQTSRSINQRQNEQIVDCKLQPEHCGTAIFASPATQKIIPSPVWVADPSAGHYDCPDGWTAYMRSEPEVFRAIYAVPAIGHQPRLDKKGHVLDEQPPIPICIQEKP